MNTIISYPLWDDRKKLLEEIATYPYIQQLTSKVQS
jgi:hypothetical protein